MDVTAIVAPDNVAQNGTLPDEAKTQVDASQPEGDKESGHVEEQVQPAPLVAPLAAAAAANGPVQEQAPQAEAADADGAQAPQSDNEEQQSDDGVVPQNTRFQRHGHLHCGDPHCNGFGSRLHRNTPIQYSKAFEPGGELKTDAAMSYYYHLLNKHINVETKLLRQGGHTAADSKAVWKSDILPAAQWLAHHSSHFSLAYCGRPIKAALGA